MNTPSKKPMVRYPAHKSKATEVYPGMDGSFAVDLESENFQAALGLIVSRWAHLEELMIMFMGLLLGEMEFPPARQIFRSVNSTQARVEILRSLLEESPLNRSKGPEFDEIINEFSALTTERNNYVHGLWYTHQGTGKISRADPSLTHEVGPFMTAKPVSIKQAEHVLKRISILQDQIIRTWAAEKARLPPPPPPS